MLVIANLPRYTFAKNYRNTAWFDKVIAKIKYCIFSFTLLSWQLRWTLDVGKLEILDVHFYALHLCKRALATIKYGSVRLSVCLSHAYIVTKRTKVLLTFLAYESQVIEFSDTKNGCRERSPPYVKFWGKLTPSLQKRRFSIDIRSQHPSPHT